MIHCFYSRAIFLKEDFLDKYLDRDTNFLKMVFTLLNEAEDAEKRMRLIKQAGGVIVTTLDVITESPTPKFFIILKTTYYEITGGTYNVKKH